MLAALAAVSGLLVAAPVASLTGAALATTPTPPPNPSQGQISAAQAAKNSLAAEVGRLSGQIAAAQSELAELQGRAEMAEQKVALAVSRKQAAQRAAQQAQAQVHKAAATVEVAHTKFVRYLQASYMTGSSDTSTGSLLTARDPSTLLQQTTLERYEAENKVDAIGSLQTATVAKSNADAAARRATQRAKRAAHKAHREKVAADAAVTAQASQEASLQQTLSTNQTQLTSAQSRLSILNHQHTQFLAYQAEQKRLAELRAARLKREQEQAREARLRREQLAREQRQREREQRQREREQQQQQHSGDSSGSNGSTGTGSSNGGSNSGGSNSGGSNSGGSNSGGSSGNGNGGNSTGSPPSSNDGGWTPAKGRYAVQRAMDWLGEPYSWAGGGADGPSYGVCAGDGAENDCNVKGFDCSGLAMYAWGPYLSMDHYAKLQYSEAGSKHPSVSHLRPGDLIFYSYNGSVSGIHHVAIYKGHGEIVQAPYSGSYVQVSSMYEPGSIFGITRPLT